MYFFVSTTICVEIKFMHKISFIVPKYEVSSLFRTNVESRY